VSSSTLRRSALVAVTTDDSEWVRAYVAEVEKTFGQEFEAAADRFKDGPALLERFRFSTSTTLLGIPTENSPCGRQNSERAG
jgi:hypothetical protein